MIAREGKLGVFRAKCYLDPKGVVMGFTAET
jgi:hypothetical protein